MVENLKKYEFMEKYHVISLCMPPFGISALERLSQGRLCDHADRIDHVYTVGALMREPQRDFLMRMLPQSRLDTYKIPASIEFVTKIAKVPNGKPDRKHYRKQEAIRQ